jgi:hypothetical protein
MTNLAETNICPKCGKNSKWYSEASYRAAVEGGIRVGTENAELRARIRDLEEDRDNFIAAFQGVSIGSAVLAVLEDNGLGEYATALANMRDRAHAAFARMRNRA